MLILTARATSRTRCVVSRRADDYVTKPFGLMELLARIDALAPRRTRTGTRGVAESVRFGAVTVYPATTV